MNMKPCVISIRQRHASISRGMHTTNVLSSRNVHRGQRVAIYQLAAHKNAKQANTNLVRSMAGGETPKDDVEEKLKEEARKREQERIEMLSKPVMPPTSQGRFGKVKKDGPDDFGAAGSTRGGEYGLGPQTDKALNVAANPDAMLIAGCALFVLFLVLVAVGPPPPSPSSLY